MWNKRGSGHWQPRFVMIPAYSSLAAPKIVLTTTSGATNDDKPGIMTAVGFQCFFKRYIQQCCPRIRYQDQWQEITFHVGSGNDLVPWGNKPLHEPKCIRGMYLPVPALDTCFWHNTSLLNSCATVWFSWRMSNARKTNAWGAKETAAGTCAHQTCSNRKLVDWCILMGKYGTLQWRFNWRVGVSKHQCIVFFTQPFVQTQIKEKI